MATRAPLICALSIGLGAGCDGDGDVDSDAPVPDAAHGDAAVPDAGAPDAAPLTGAPPVGECRDGWCWVFPLPQGNQLRSIWGTSADDVWVLGDRSVLLHYEDGAWTSHGGSGDLIWRGGHSQLWGTGPDDVWAAASDGGVLHWNGAAWSVSTQGDIRAIGGTGASDVWAYDATTRAALQWNGSTWTSRGLPATGWRALAFGGSPGSALFVSTSGGIATWLGATWGILDGGSRPANAAVVLDDRHVILAQNGALAFWDGATWTTRTPPVTANWNTIAATSFDDVWISGSATGVEYRYHWNGAAWLAADVLGTPDAASALWIDPDGAPWTAQRNAEVRAWNGTSWQPRTIGDSHVSAVWGTAENDIWALGGAEHPDRARAFHWNGAAWAPVALPFDATYWPARIWGSAPDDYWIAAGRWNLSNRMERYVLHWNGATWTGVGPFGSEDAILEPVGFASIWGSAADDIYAVARTAVYHYDGQTWQPVTAGPPGGSDVFGTARDDVYVLHDANLWRWDGTRWTSKTSPQDELVSGWANAPSDVWLSARSASAIHYDGAAFRVLDDDVMEGVPVGAAGDMFTFDGFRMTRRVGGADGTAVETPLFFAPWNGWRAPSGRVYAAGHGLLVH